MMQDCQLVILVTLRRIDLPHVTAFACRKKDPALGGGWSGQFELERGSTVGAAFITGVSGMERCSFYQYVSAWDGTVSTYQHFNALFIGVENISPDKCRITFNCRSRRRL
jgi:hypothetical protein